ncbi:MAG: hypothetical protein OXR73_28800, partial [Myxococcales bacterium]|nr:hypothetical protein [Myxococcales bacterium]
PPLPPLPPSLRCLALDGDGYRDLSSLTGLTQLQWLDVKAQDKLDASMLGSMQDLRLLAVEAPGFQHPVSLARLTRLRSLTLSESLPKDGPLSNLRFVTDLRALRHLDIARTEVQDLSPLGHLNDLTHVDATGPRARLPAGPLASLEVLHASVARDAATSFRATHPHAVLVTSHLEAIQYAFGRATLLRVVDMGLGRSVSYEERNPQAIADLAGHFRFYETEPWLHLCVGGPTLEVYADQRPLGRINLEHATAVTGPGHHWHELQPESSAAITQWLADRGVTGPQQELERKRRHQSP